MFSLKTIIRSFSLAVLLMLTLVAPMLAADKPLTPTALPGGTVIGPAEAKALLDGKQALFFDMRSAINFGKGHIPGATALPYKENSEFVADFNAAVDQFDLARLPADKGAVLVFYSDGPTGWKSYKAAVLAIKAGYKQVKWFREGMSSWLSAQYPVN